VVADALGLHLDLFQRIVVDPCSVTAIRYTSTRPYVLGLNESASGLARFVPPKKPARRRGKRTAGDAAGDAETSVTTDAMDATIGGGAGHGSV